MHADAFTRIFETSSTSAGSLLSTDLDRLEQDAASAEVAAWQLLLGAMALRRSGQRSAANEWLNRATRLAVTDDVFRAELLGEAGQGLYESDRLEDAFGILNSALSIWRSVSHEALSTRSSPEAADAFADRLLPLLDAGDVEIPDAGDIALPDASDVALPDAGVNARSLVPRWLVQRAVLGRAETAAALIRVLARGGRVVEGRELCIEEVDWTTQTFVPPRVEQELPSWVGELGEPQAPRPVRIALYVLHLARGEVELAADEFEASAQYFADAAAVFERNAADYSDVSRLLRAKFNQANSLLRLQRFDEALAIYEMCEYGMRSIGDAAGEQRVAHAKAFARNASGVGSGASDDVRQLVIDGEAVAREAADPAKAKAPLLPQYGMYLTALSTGAGPLVDRAEDALRVIGAMRDVDVYANLESAPRDDDASIERIAGSPLHVLAGYLARLPDTAVLAIETGARSLSIFALRGGSEPLEERLVLERASQDFVDAMVALMQQQREDLDRIERRERIDRTLFDPIERAAQDVWTAMPAKVRAVITEASTLLYLPSAFGDLSTFPLELVRSDDGWLGETHVIARLSSLRTLFELLSPNRMPAWLDARALIVRAQDSDELKGADAEVMSVSEKLEAMHMDVSVDMSPRVATLRDAFDRGLRVLHHCGHGLAGDLGESLPINAQESLGPHAFSQLSGWGTPFVYLSTCDVGRARMTTTGSAAGFSTRLIEKGAPGVIGCLESVPDMVAHAMANAFYDAAASLPTGEALSAARVTLARFPPSCLGAFAYFGDPSFDLDATGRAASGIRQRTLRWDSMIGRHVAIRSATSRQQVLDALNAARDVGTPEAETLDAVAAWIEESFSPHEPEVVDARLALCRDVAQRDAVAGCQLRMLLAMEVVHGSYYGERKPDIVLSPEELAVGLFCARAVHDTIAWPAFVTECALSGGLGYEPPELLRMLDEAAGMLAGWSREEPAAAQMLSVVERCMRDLGQKRPIDAQ